ncbi:MAG: DUF4364 family protein [Firmicutes bacterium]|nr:DUF4364 family protein [Bacillota bacterium]
MELDRNLDFVADDMDMKLMLLFIFEKMEFPLTDSSISEIIVGNPNWMSYMDFRTVIYQLVESRFILRSSQGSDSLYAITQSGKACLGHFYSKIPPSIREEITAYSRENKQKFKRSQEYNYDYYKNADGTYTIILRIKEHTSVENVLEIKKKVQTRAEAIRATAKWRDKAPQAYEAIYNVLISDD